MLYELRTYQAMPGRAPELVRRFRDRTLQLFALHGLDVVFIGQTELGDDCINELVYVLRHESYAEMFRRWNTFLKDDEWAAIRADTEADGPLVASVKRSVHTDSFFQRVPSS